MKRIILISFATLLYSVVFGQMTPEAYLNLAPDVPDAVCGTTSNDYLIKVKEFSDRLEADIAQRRLETDENIEKNGDEMHAQTLRNVGFTGANASEIKGAENMSDKEIEDLVNKMMKQGMNTSMTEFNKLEKLDTNGQKAWAEGLSTEQMADAQVDPEHIKAQQEKNKSIYELSFEWKSLLDKHAAGELKYSQKLDTLQKEADIAMKKFREKLKPLEDELKNTDDDKQKASLSKQIAEIGKQFSDEYCQQFGPPFSKIVAEYKIYISSVLPDINHEEEVQNQLTQAQAGNTQPLARPGLLGLLEVKAYVDLLLNIYKYNINL